MTWLRKGLKRSTGLLEAVETVAPPHWDLPPQPPPSAAAKMGRWKREAGRERSRVKAMPLSAGSRAARSTEVQ
jgi:hypothetical protein